MHTKPRVVPGQIGGAVPQGHDPRDYDFRASPGLLSQVAEVTSCDLRESGFMPPVWNQGHYPSCAAHAIAAAWAFAEARTLHMPPGRPSRLFIWYEGRRIQGDDPKTKKAIDLRAGFFATSKTGVPDEALWPYKVRNFTKKPPKSVYDAAKKLHAHVYLSPAHTLEGLKAPLVAGYPVAAVFSVFNSFKPQIAAETFDYSMPKDSEQSYDQHAILIVGFDDQAKKFKVRNSQGKDWGSDGGYATLSYEFVLSPHVMDFWTLMPKVGNDDG